MRPGALVVSPVFVGATAVLLLNDHVVKVMWPGFVAGKLSDVAGVVMVAVGLTALLRRPSVAFVATAVGFGLLETVPAVAHGAAPVLGGVTGTDPTDLVALTALVPLWWWIRHPTRARSPGNVARIWVVPAQVLAIGAAVVATTATSCSPDGVSQLAVASDGTLVADSFPQHVSRDGGATWVAEPIEWPSHDEAACFADGVCLRIERDETTTSLVADDAAVLLAYHWQELDGLGRLDRPSCGGSLFDDVAVVERDGVDHVVVAMGWLGVLHAERGGDFEWVAVGEWGVQEQDVGDRPLGLDVASATGDDGIGFRLARRLSIGLVALSMVIPVALLWPLSASATRRGRSPVPVLVADGLVALGALLVGGWMLVATWVFEPTRSTLTVFALGLLSVVTLASSVIVVVHALVPPRRQALRPPDPRQRVG